MCQLQSRRRLKRILILEAQYDLLAKAPPCRVAFVQ
jgi:hypothetical protein